MFDYMHDYANPAQDSEEPDEDTSIPEGEYTADIEGWYEHVLDTMDRVDQPYRSYLQGAATLADGTGFILEGTLNALDGDGFLPNGPDTEDESSEYWSLGQKAAARNYNSDEGALSYLAGMGTVIGLGIVTAGTSLVSTSSSILAVFDLLNLASDNDVEEVDDMLEPEDGESGV